MMAQGLGTVAPSPGDGGNEVEERQQRGRGTMAPK
jgi:hypothetical protein